MKGIWNDRVHIVKQVSISSAADNFSILDLVGNLTARYSTHMGLGNIPVHDRFACFALDVPKVPVDQSELYTYRYSRYDIDAWWPLLVRQSASGLLDGRLVRLDS